MENKMSELSSRSSWWGLASCQGVNPDLFFPASEQDATPALEICASCPVREVCLEHALTSEEREGIWGATTPRQRREMRRSKSA